MSLTYRIEITQKPYGFIAEVISPEGHKAAIRTVCRSKRGALRSASALIRRLELAHQLNVPTP